jgi:hypothetical protein
MSYLRYLCLLAYSGVQHNTYACIVLCFLFGLSSSCVPNIASFSRMPILDCPLGFL